MADIAATAAGYFGAMVDEYDSLIRRAVPRYDEMTARLVDYLPGDARRVLELGCGTGNLTVALAARYPHAQLTLVDASPEMLAATRARLVACAPTVAASARYIEARFEELVLAPEAHDLAVSSISLHHVRDKGPLYRALNAALSTDGALCFSDQMAGASSRLHELNRRRWLEWCRAPGQLGEGEIQSLLDHAAAHDHYTALPDQLTLLGAAGFHPIDCVWRNWKWGIVVAAKSGNG